MFKDKKTVLATIVGILLLVIIFISEQKFHVLLLYWIIPIVSMIEYHSSQPKSSYKKRKRHG